MPFCARLSLRDLYGNRLAEPPAEGGESGAEYLELYFDLGEGGGGLRGRAAQLPALLHLPPPAALGPHFELG